MLSFHSALRTAVKISVLFALVVLTCVSTGVDLARAQDVDAVDVSINVDLPVIDASDMAALKNAVGKHVFVDGTIKQAVWSSTGKVMNIEFDAPDGQGLLAAVFEKTRKAFDDGFNGDAVTTFTGAKVRVKGRIEEYGGFVEEYKGRPQMLLRFASQVTIIEPGPGAATTTPSTVQ